MSDKEGEEETLQDVNGHDEAISRIINELLDGNVELRWGFERAKISVICHRIVHEGHLAYGMRINAETIGFLEKLSDLTPLHSGPA